MVKNSIDEMARRSQSRRILKERGLMAAAVVHIDGLRERRKSEQQDREDQESCKNPGCDCQVIVFHFSQANAWSLVRCVS